MLIMAVSMWILTGFVGHIYWWRQEFDVTYGDVIVAVVIGALLGPFNFVLGWALHSPRFPRRRWWAKVWLPRKGPY